MNDYYMEKYYSVSEKYVYGNSAPRGRILDRNGKVLVDNVGINSIYYRDLGNIKKEDIANYLNLIIERKIEASDDELKKYYLEHNETDYLLTDDEKDDFNYRRISVSDVQDLKYSRMDSIISEYSAND